MDVSTDEFLRTDYCLSDYDAPEVIVQTVAGDLAIKDLRPGQELLSPEGTAEVKEVSSQTTHVYLVSPGGGRRSYQLRGDESVCLVLIRGPEVRGDHAIWIGEDAQLHRQRFSCTLAALAALKSKPCKHTTYLVKASALFEMEEEHRNYFRPRYAQPVYEERQVPLLPRSAAAIASCVPDAYLRNSVEVRKAFLAGLIDRSGTFRSEEGSEAPSVPLVRNVKKLLWSLGVSFEVHQGRLALTGRELQPLSITYEGVQPHLQLRLATPGFYLADDFSVRWSD